MIDWATPDNNEFFLASQMWVAGDMYRRRCDLLAFVNGLPLVFIELKKPAVPLKSAFDGNLKDYKGQSVPQHCAIQVVRALERDPLLIQEDGPHKGKLAFPWGPRGSGSAK